MKALPSGLERVKNLVRDVPDFPKDGILFKDITPVLQHPEAFKCVVDLMTEEFSKIKIDAVVGIESRGFIFSPLLAYRLGAGFVPVRKKGKLPYKTEQIGYALEYGEAILEIHQDAIKPGARIVIVDDLLATGGTARAAAHLVEKLGGKVEKFGFLIELNFLKGREKLAPGEVFSLIQY